MPKRLCPKHGIWTPENNKDRCPKCVSTINKQYDKGHRNKESNKVYQSKQWKETRKEVILRDGFKCTKCGSPIGIKPKDHAVDHIIELTDGGEAFDMDNLQTLCASCHNKKSKGGA